jgi:hypothetical protein
MPATTTMKGAFALGLVLLTLLPFLALGEGQHHRALAGDDAPTDVGKKSSIVPSAGEAVLWNDDGDVSASGRKRVPISG